MGAVSNVMPQRAIGSCRQVPYSGVGRMCVIKLDKYHSSQVVERLSLVEMIPSEEQISQRMLFKQNKAAFYKSKEWKQFKESSPEFVIEIMEKLTLCLDMAAYVVGKGKANLVLCFNKFLYGIQILNKEGKTKLSFFNLKKLVNSNFEQKGSYISSLCYIKFTSSITKRLMTAET